MGEVGEGVINTSAVPPHLQLESAVMTVTAEQLRGQTVKLTRMKLRHDSKQSELEGDKSSSASLRKCLVPADLGVPSWEMLAEIAKGAVKK